VLALQLPQSEARTVVIGVECDQVPQRTLRGRPVANSLGGIDITPQLSGEETTRVFESGDRISERRRLLCHRRQEFDRGRVVTTFDCLEAVQISGLKRFEAGLDLIGSLGGVSIADDGCESFARRHDIPGPGGVLGGGVG
jgi:hypothetical protein